ncbi:MAG: ABC transporter ATP-binding protein [Oscillospiraceae bacterium]|nr:ABC transporter ATP-binding protein [Oscillospiraceae bacterium]
MLEQKIALEVKDINTYYGFSHILHGVSLRIPEGKVVALLGRNGAGKTTTIRSIMGLTPPQNGEILFRGEPIHNKPAFKISQMGVGICPQGRRLFKSLTVKEHLDVYVRGSKAWTPERALEYFPRLAERLNNKGNELSGGEQQMLALARMLVTNPSLILLDEPTEGLAPLIVNEVGELIKIIKNEGYPILLTEQKLKFALDLADEVYVMNKGQIVYYGTPEELEANEEVKQSYLGV